MGSRSFNHQATNPKHKSEASICLRICFVFPLLVFKGVYHYLKYFLAFPWLLTKWKEGSYLRVVFLEPFRGNFGDETSILRCFLV